MSENQPTGITEEIEETDVDTGLPFHVMLYNDDYHTFDEVIVQLIKAIQCTFEKARDYAFEVHVKGRAAVFAGQLNRCLKVSSVLQEIDLHTQIVS
jgi:ATP-dependent Clp protease adapter protein ClpS